MNWRRAVSIFIVIFLILDICLLGLIIKNVYQANYLRAQSMDSLEQRLINQNIKYSISNIDINDFSYITAQPTSFTTTELNNKIGPGDKYRLSDDNKLLDVEIGQVINYSNEKTTKLALNEYILRYVIKGDEYQFFKREGNKIIYEQLLNASPVFNNEYGKLVFYIEYNKIVRYSQSLLGEVTTKNLDHAIIVPEKAVNILWDANLLPQYSSVRTELGYFTSIPNRETQVLGPSWRVEVTTKQGQVAYYYVDGIRGKLLNVQSVKRDQDTTINEVTTTIDNFE